MVIQEGKVGLKFYSVLFLVISLSLVYLVAAALSAPTGLIVSRNSTAVFDDGSFNVNWTAVAADGDNATKNYSIYVFSNNSLYLKGVNNSDTGYSFSNTTEANYTFIIEAVNTTGTDANTNSTTNISIYVDSTAPTIAISGYSNATFKKNTDSLSLNISIIDSLSNLTGSACLVNINGTNQTIAISNGWCNTTTTALTNLSDGNQTIYVYVNDSANNLGLNDSFIVPMDTTAPLLSLISPVNSASSTNTSWTFSYQVNETNLNLNCSLSINSTIVDSNSSVNQTWETNSFTRTGLSVGGYNWSINCTDLAGNSNVSEIRNITITAPSTSTSNEGSTITSGFWTRTFVPSSQQLTNGWNFNLSTQQRGQITLNSSIHYVGIVALNTSYATINISSTPQQAIFAIGDEKKFDATEDGYYDIAIKLNDIQYGLAKLTITTIYELKSIAPLNISNMNSSINNSLGTSAGNGGKKSNIFIWIFFVVVGLVIIVFIAAWIYHNRKPKKYIRVNVKKN